MRRRVLLALVQERQLLVSFHEPPPGLEASATLPLIEEDGALVYGGLLTRSLALTLHVRRAAPKAHPYPLAQV